MKQFQIRICIRNRGKYIRTLNFTLKTPLGLRSLYHIIKILSNSLIVSVEDKSVLVNLPVSQTVSDNISLRVSKQDNCFTKKGSYLS